MTKDYRAKRTDEIGLLKGQYVSVMEKNFNGWWLVKSTDNRTGLAPAVYLKPFKAGNIEDTTKFNSSIFQTASYLPPRQDFFSNPTIACTSDTNSFTSSSFDSISVITTSDCDASYTNASANPTSSQMSPTDTYFAVESYQDTVGDGVSLVKDEQVQVVEKSDNGWWFVRLANGSEGWAPSAFLSVRRKKNSF